MYVGWLMGMYVDCRGVPKEEWFNDISIQSSAQFVQKTIFNLSEMIALLDLFWKNHCENIMAVEFLCILYFWTVFIIDYNLFQSIWLDYYE